jgi:short-chain fatty acids transporter
MAQLNEAAKTRSSGNPITRMGGSLLRWSLKYMPDASIFAVILTFIAFLLGIFVAGQTPMKMIQNWYTGFWELLAFSMQMALIVVTGSCVANAPLVKRSINHLASIPKTSKQAVYLVTLVSILVSYIHWGLSLIVGALLAKEMAKNLRLKKVPFEYGLIAAGAYVGQMTWHGMLSASIGLSIATKGHALEDMIGIIPMSEYMFNTMNIVTTILLALLPPLFASLMHPKYVEDFQPLDEEALYAIEKEDQVIVKKPQNASVGDVLNYSPIVAWALGIMGFVYIVWRFATKGFDLDINLINAIFLFGGILLYGNIANYVRAVKDATTGVSGIIFQFPLYAGVLGMVKYSGLVTIWPTGLWPSVPAPHFICGHSCRRLWSICLYPPAADSGLCRDPLR